MQVQAPINTLYSTPQQQFHQQPPQQLQQQIQPPPNPSPPHSTPSPTITTTKKSKTEKNEVEGNYTINPVYATGNAAMTVRTYIFLPGKYTTSCDLRQSEVPFLLEQCYGIS